MKPLRTCEWSRPCGAMPVAVVTPMRPLAVAVAPCGTHLGAAVRALLTDHDHVKVRPYGR